MAKAKAKRCPCGAGFLNRCCRRYIRAEALPPTAEALMRSRYTACTLGALEYLVETHDPVTRGDMDYADMGRFIAEAKWLRLEVHSTDAGQAGDSFGRVSFSAHHTLSGEPEVLDEDSLFRRLETEGDRWVYVGHADQHAK